MAYQGISPYLYRNNLTNVQLLDDISASFNGTTTQFNLTTNGSPFHAVSARSLLIILGGIVQEPDSDYTVSAGVITFTTAPLSGLTFAARNIYGLNRLTGINDGLVTPASLSLGGPEWDTSGNLTVDGNITQTGATNNVYINTDTPTVRPTLDLNFERDRRLDSRITYSRSSTATYLGSDGLIKTALVNEPRFEYDINGNSLGLLLEEQRTNLVTYSEDLSNNAWSKTTGTTIVTNATTAPDGTLTADRVVYDGTGTSGSYRVYISPLMSVSGVIYTASIWLKSDSATTVRLYGNGNTGAGPFVTCNLTTEWKRFSTTGTGGNGVSSVQLLLYSASGDNTAISFYAWGAQVEVGSFPTSYIPTVASAVTRSADTASMTGTNLTEWFNRTEGTMVLTADIGDLTVPNQNFVVIEDSLYTGQQFIAMGYRSGGGGSGYVASWLVDNQANSAFLSHNASISSNVQFKHSFAYKQNDFAGSVNGSSLLTDTNGTVNSPTYTLNRLRFGQYYYGDTIDTGHIKRFTYYPKRLTNNQLSNLTS